MGTQLMQLNLVGVQTANIPALKQLKVLSWWAVASGTGETRNMIQEVQFQEQVKEFKGSLDTKTLLSSLQYSEAGFYNSGKLLQRQLFGLLLQWLQGKQKKYGFHITKKSTRKVHLNMPKPFLAR